MRSILYGSQDHRRRTSVGILLAQFVFFFLLYCYGIYRNVKKQEQFLSSSMKTDNDEVTLVNHHQKQTQDNKYVEMIEVVEAYEEEEDVVEKDEERV